MASTNQKYKGIFNWYGATMTLYCYACSERHALFLFIGKIAKKVERDRHNIFFYFADQTRDGYRIEKVSK